MQKCVNLEDFDLDKIMLSEVTTFVYPTVQVWYERPGQSLCVVFSNVKSFFGVQVLNARHLFLSTQITMSESSKLRQIYNRILKLLFPIRIQFLSGFKNVNKITAPYQMRYMVSDPIQTGHMMPVAGGDHQYTVLVPSRFLNNTQVVDCEACVVSGTEHKDCKNTCQGKTLAQLCIQIGPVYYKEAICVVSRVREIVYDCSHLNDPVVNSYTGTTNVQDDTGSEIFECGCREGMCSLSWLEDK
jgi:hypothetical protein